eukprot:TRINITY_DN8009_c0_g1_i1.p1 TRINITY_DN8009_c0_g1~~TRINITY_DN8009_c0_g1_i1.p1  ORF type:complete len:307 (+),score=55.15 TRINITY_DN8009_c0_g1_i1:45-923(+)
MEGYNCDEALLHLVGGTCAVLITGSFLIGWATDNVSQVDKLWTTAPIIYTIEVLGYLYYTKGHVEGRVLLMSALVVVWGARLGNEFRKKGGFNGGWKFWKGEEDYRWIHVRGWPSLKNYWVWVLFNLIIICMYQLVLILGFSSPLFAVIDGAPLSSADGALAVTMLVVLVVQHFADAQQQRFQTKKYSLLKECKTIAALPAPYNKGFVCSGLFAYSRHPNWLCEMTFWFLFAAFIIPARGLPHYGCVSSIGSYMLFLLMNGSRQLTEAISAEKYPEYKEYQKKVKSFVPFVF